MEKEIKILLPKLGESILTATIVECLKKVGDEIDEDETFFEVSTDKVNSEIPSPVSGIVKEIVVHEKQEIKVGQLMAIIETKRGVETKANEKKIDSSPTIQNQTNSNFFSPVVLKIAQKNNVSIDELSKITGSGAGGRVSKKDLEKYIESRKGSDKKEHIKLSTLRKKIAKSMVLSSKEIPQASLITEVDVTDILSIIKLEKQRLIDEKGVKLTITSFVAYSIAKACVNFPLLNSSIKDEDTILVNRHVNLGIAVNIEDGVIVPTIKNIHEMDLLAVSRQINVLSNKSRDNDLNVDDVQNGTITLTNYGMSGIEIGLPIIKYPEVAIIGVGAIKKKPIVDETDSIVIRSMMGLSLTFDHRIVDGMYGCNFLNEIKNSLKQIKSL
jgi:2-oxoglutarate dehydrogenase E2 component (dihydrolipoamide succinyltransferase)